MRTTWISALVVIAGTAAFAQVTPVPHQAAAPYRTHPPAPHCCHEKVWDRDGREIGDLLSYDNSYAPQQLVGYVAYRLAGGDAVTLKVTPEVLTGLQAPGGSNALFTTPDCSGPTMFAVVSWPPLAKRYAMVLLQGPNPFTSATNAWLFASDPLPSRVITGAGTVFHSQWGDTETCQPFPAPGYTMTYAPGGYWMHRVEDLYVKFKRPFYVDY